MYYLYSEKASYRDIYQARQELKDFHLTEEQLMLSCLPNTPKARQVFYWLTDLIKLIGDVAPNKENLVQLPGFYTKADIYNRFKRFVTLVYTGDEHDVASKTMFKKIWKNVYPQVNIITSKHDFYVIELTTNRVLMLGENNTIC